MKNSFYIKQTNSTNEQLFGMSREYELPEGFVLYTDFQTSGKGQVGNVWESADGKNLLFSILLYPEHVSLTEHFIISQLVSVSIKRILDEYTDDISIKWPNDIYWKDRKIGGILIENSLQHAKIKQTVIGVGLNINQKEFSDKLPNPVSLFQITNKRNARKPILENIRNCMLDIYKNNDYSLIRAEYMSTLYRKEKFHLFRDETKTFEARIHQVQPDGRLDLETKDGQLCSYYFKEVQFVI